MVDANRAGIGGRQTAKGEWHWPWFVPVLVLLGAVTLYPTAFVAWMSLHRTQYFELREFVGLANYAEALTSPGFQDISLTSLIYVFGSLVLVAPIGLVAAIVFNEMGALGKALRVVSLLPWTLSMAVVGTIWLWILNPSFGPLAYGLSQIGVTPGLMLGDPGAALYFVILATVWWSFPYVMVMMTAALQAVPRELYEAVEIDGGGTLAKFRFVTMPHIAPMLGSTLLALSILYLTLVTLIIVLTGGGPLGATTTWSFDIFRQTVQAQNVAPAAAASVIVLCVNIALGALYVRLTGKVSA